jgi:predicted regulator of Ras-like GTPase activity (Roadblock/LC7/MglB family)
MNERLTTSSLLANVSTGPRTWDKALDHPLANPLESLRDVAGVEGSFVVSDMGRLLARDMPPVFGDDVLGEVAPRALHLRDTLGYAGEEMECAVIRYADYLLILRPLNDGVLCALTARSVNLPAVKMALSLCARRLGGGGRSQTKTSSKTAPGTAPLALPPAREATSAGEAPRARFSGRSRGYGF